VRDYYTGAAWPALRAEYLKCIEERRTVYRTDTAQHRLMRDSFDFERIFLPLASDGIHVDMIVGLVAFLPVGTFDRYLGTRAAGE
jgi:hypothetical protein